MPRIRPCNFAPTLLPFLILLATPAAADPPPADQLFLGAGSPPSTPRLFAPGIVNTGLVTRDVAITPDGSEIYFGQVVAGYAQAAICVTSWRDGRWTEPEVAPFSGGPDGVDLEPAISPDGSRFFFYSTRPHPGGGEDPQDLWMMDRTDDGWSEPRPVGAPVNTDQPEFFPSIDRDGNLYFCRADPETRIHTLWRAEPLGDGFAEPELLPEVLNAGRNRFNAQVAPDGERIVVPVAGHPGNHGGVDYWLGLRGADGNWDRLLNLGPAINDGSGQTWSPAFSPDGSAFFYLSARAVQEPIWPQTWSRLQARHRAPGQGQGQIWWTSAAFLDEVAAGREPVFAEDPAPAPALPAGPQFPVLTGPLLGQGDPPARPAPFAPGLVSTGLTERDIVFTPDGRRVLFGIMDLGLVTLLESELLDGIWTEPRTAGFHPDPDFACFEPTFTADGRSVIFLSNRAAPGQTQGRGWANQNLFSSTLGPDGWSDPVALPPPVTSEAAEYFPSLARDGTLYFSREDAAGNARLWSAEPTQAGGFAEPQLLPAAVNLGAATYNATVAADESWLIACVRGHEQNLGPADYWISFRDPQGEWSPARNLGERFNGPDLRAASVSLSPDGRALFFSTQRRDPAAGPASRKWTRAALLEQHDRCGNGGSDVWWVSAAVLDTYR